jgi:protein TonB
MKKVAFFLSCLIIINSASAQVNTNPDVGKIYVSAQVSPSFPGGDAAWQSFVAANIDIDTLVKNGAPAGNYTVTMRFIVGMDSEVSDVTCTNDPGFGMCREAIRLIKKSGKWNLGKQNGRFVNSFKSQPIVFRIN